MYLQALKQIFSITLTVILFITIPVVALTLISSRVQIFGIQSFVVMSGSMEPSIPTGSVIYTLRLPQYRAGDVIAYKSGKVNVTHRVVNVSKNESGVYYQTRGDANDDPDSKLVASRDVLGANMYTIWNLGKLIMALKTVQGFLIFLIVPSLIFIGFEFWNIKREFEKEIRKKVLASLR